MMIGTDVVPAARSNRSLAISSQQNPPMASNRGGDHHSKGGGRLANDSNQQINLNIGVTAANIEDQNQAVPPLNIDVVQKKTER